MEIANILVSKNGIIDNIVSITFDDNVKQPELLKKIEDEINIIIKKENIIMDENEKNTLFEDGYFDDNNGFEISILDSPKIINL